MLALALGFGFAVGARAAEVKSIVLPAAEDLSLPFWCHWGYDWYERCYRDDSDRLELGGAEDKVWRSALRFSVEALPPEAMVITAELSLRYDATCVAPRRGFRACDGRAYDLRARPIYTRLWLSERGVEFGPVSTIAYLARQAPRDDSM